MSVIAAESILNDWENKGLIDPIPVVLDAPRPSAEILAGWRQNGQLWRGEQRENRNAIKEIKRANRKERTAGLSFAKKVSSVLKYFWEGDPEGYEATKRVIAGLAWEPVDTKPAEREPELGVRLNQGPQKLSSRPLVDEAAAYWQEENPWGDGYEEWRIAYNACRVAAKQELREQRGFFGRIGLFINPKREEVHQIALCASLGIIGENTGKTDLAAGLALGQGLDVDRPGKTRHKRAEEVKTLNKTARRTILSLGCAAIFAGSPAAASYTWSESSEFGQVLFSTVHEAGQPEFFPTDTGDVAPQDEIPLVANGSLDR